jgi:hypothetical protein
VVSIPQLLREISGVQPHETVQKDRTNERTSPDAGGISYARPLKVAKAERFLKWGSYICVLICKPCRLLAKDKLRSLAKAFCLSKGNITSNGIYFLPRDNSESSFLYRTDSLMFTL